eukprot:NODE_20702_length_786_cov_2.283763.p1 GENE.NODE_20702_length_786_cov_2.283763~~NODE_20702_length_786_cov_2.283763.p1  ORF type:complete len:122 (-),score=33.87 NODE_20702_length_786_cov_2.283763:307-672(-)
MDWVGIGALIGGVAVGLGAFGAHGLKDRVQDVQKLESWKTAAYYQILHAIIIIVAADHAPGVEIVPILFFAGILLFSGSIYALVLLPQGHKARKVLGPATPIGGLLLILGWLTFAFGGLLG